MRTQIAGLFLCAALLGINADAADVQQVATPCQPGISFASLLGAVNVGYADGRLRIDKLYAVCLPAPQAPSDSNYAYSPGQGGKLTTAVRAADGQIINTYVWSAENISGLWELSEYKVLGGVVKPLSAGRYTLEFQADAAAFYRFPFAVTTAASDDPYQPPGTRYFIEGPWNEYGNIFYQRNDPESTLRFSVWVQDKTTHEQQRSIPYEAQLVRVRDGKLLGQDKAELRADPQWKTLDVYFQAAGGDASSHLKAGEVLREDGAYRVALNIDGKPYGVYTFTVSGGKIQLQGLQADGTDPHNRIVDYLYGGRYRSWWIPRSGSDAK
jgi:hypothetical protein